MALRISPMRVLLSAIRAWTRCSAVDTAVPLVGVELVHVPDLAQGPPHVLHDSHLFERRVQRIGCRTDGIDHGVPSSIRSDSCVLGRGARRLGGHACLLARDPRALSGLSQPLTFLSNGFERLAMMVTNLTRFFSESPELLRLASGSLGGRAIFRSLTDHVVITTFVHDITCYQSTGLDAREVS